MLVLGIETAAELAGVALVADGAPVAGAWVAGGRRHAEALAPAVAHVLDQAGVTASDLGAVAVDVGPGLFTGIRVGVATAQGLAQGLGVGVVGVTSCAALAAAAYGAGWDGPLAAVLDARRGEVFCARYAGPTHETHPPARHTPADLAGELAAAPGLLAVGGGALRYADVLTGIRVAPAVADPDPRAVALLAARRLARGEEPLAPSHVRPVYLREADARINWATR